MLTLTLCGPFDDPDMKPHPQLKSARQKHMAVLTTGHALRLVLEEMVVINLRELNNEAFIDV